MNIKILGPGCKNCKKLEDNTKSALEELNLDISIEKITDFKDIVSYGVMQTPALLIDDKIKIVGSSSNISEIKNIIEKL